MSSTDWQPIETAPRDGTWFLAAARHKQEGETLLFTTFWSPVNPPTWYVNGVGWYRDETPVTLTHWAPLPEPPTVRDRARPRPNLPGVYRAAAPSHA